MKKSIHSLFTMFASMMAVMSATAQTLPQSQEELESVILHHDSIFWEAYNVCDTKTMRSYLADDVEFYHDKGGVTFGGDKLIEGTKNGICKTRDFYLRREEINGSLEVHPVPGHGAILYGEHLFYINQKGTEEYLDGQAKFAHVWKLTEDGWKMTRVLSYAHMPPAKEFKIVEIAEERLNAYTGQYTSKAFGEVTVSKENDHLRLKAGKFDAELYPEADNLFFVKERELQFRFEGDGTATKLIVIEKGNVVDEALRAD